MTSIVELFPKCRKLAYDARQQLAVLQQQQPQSKGGGSVSELYLVLEELTRQLNCMDDLVLRETPEQRPVWKRKIYDLRQECSTIQQTGATLEQMLRKQQRSNANSYQSDRDELLTLRRRKTNTAGDGNNDISTLVDERSSIEQSNFIVRDILNVGTLSLDNLQGQRQRLHGVSRTMASIDSRLGLTQMTMKIIERRDITDAYLIIAGMIITCIVIYFAWFYEFN